MRGHTFNVGILRVLPLPSRAAYEYPCFAQTYDWSGHYSGLQDVLQQVEIAMTLGPGTVVVITGAGSGIGRALALEGVQRGWCVVGLDRRGDRLSELVTSSAITSVVVDVSATLTRCIVLHAMYGTNMATWTS